jgi:peptidoglycan/LPS O-acetylase OafA/YrhL
LRGQMVSLRFWSANMVSRDPNLLHRNGRTSGALATDNSTRLHLLDVFRFCAALAVLLYHYVSSYVDYAELPSALRAATHVTRYGYLGVELFFMISGFVILWSAQGRTATQFAVSRVSRLYPTFWVAMLLSTLLIVISENWRAGAGDTPISLARLVANATMVPSLLGAVPIDGVYWTLEFEIRFYLLVFVLILVRQMENSERWLYIWLALCAWSEFGSPPWAVTYFALAPYGPFFIAGSLFYLIYALGFSVPRVIALGATAALTISASLKVRSSFLTPDVVSQWVVPVVVAGFFILFLGMLLHRERGDSVAPCTESFGALTYPLYLTHATLGSILIEVLTPSIGVSASLFAATLLALGLAQVLSVTVDIPARRPMREACFKGLRFVRRALAVRVEKGRPL